MKKRNWIIGVPIIILALLCIVLWRQKEVEREKMESLCECSAAMALEKFTSYSETGKESDYIGGVAEFRSFMTAYLFLNDNVGNAEYTWCNTVYGDMVLSPEKVQNDVQGLINALGYLSKGYDDPNGYLLIHAYSNELRHGNDG